MILVACEISQTVTIEFRKLGFDAYSADIDSVYEDPPIGGNPKWHIQGDVLKILNLHKWKMVIAFPPCTHLCVSGAKHFRKKRILGLQQQGIEFFLEFTRCKSDFIAIENPIGIMSNLYRKPDQIVQPYEYGEPYRKSTCLWLKNLPKLVPTNPINCGEIGIRGQPGWYEDSWYESKHDRKKIRSKTFPGIAKAMAEQWSKVL